jgi:hypothetical protein
MRPNILETNYMKNYTYTEHMLKEALEGRPVAQRPPN